MSGERCGAFISLSVGPSQTPFHHAQTGQNGRRGWRWCRRISLKKDVQSTERKAGESSVIAAKATTVAAETKQSLAVLEKRVLQIEQGSVLITPCNQQPVPLERSRPSNSQ